MTQRSERAQHSSEEAEGCALHWPQPLEDEAYLIRWPWRSPQPRDLIGKEPRNIRIPTQENRVFWLLSAPHPARRDETCLGSTHTRTDSPIAVVRALCLSNPASKGRRWRRDASRAALLRLSHSFLTFVARPSLAFSPHYTNTTQQQQQPNFRCCRHSFASVFSCCKRLLDVPFLSRLLVVQSLFSLRCLYFSPF